MITQNQVDSAVADSTDLDTFIAAVQDVVNNPPADKTPATHEDAVATQAKLDELIAAVQALKDAATPPPVA